MGKIVLFANQKGGVGKTTLCGHFSNYLISRNQPIYVIDADTQKTLSGVRNGDIDELKRTHPDTDPNDFMSYEIDDRINLNDGLTMKKLAPILKAKDYTTVVDTPGTLNAPGMVELVVVADFIICPYFFDMNTLLSTREFCGVISKIKELRPDCKVQLLFLCNRKKASLGTRAEQEAWKEMNKFFAYFGKVVPDSLGDLKCLANYSTVANTDDASYKLKPAFDFIYNEIYGDPNYGK